MAEIADCATASSWSKGEMLVNDVNSGTAMAKTRSMIIGLGLLGVAGVILFFTSGFVFQAFRGPRPVTDQELLHVTVPRSRDNYVSFTPSQPMVGTGLQWGVKNNPGTKYLLLPVGDRLMLCSARIADNGPTFIGRLEQISGDPEGEVLRRVTSSDPRTGQLVMPIMLQAVRSIWFDTGVALVFILGFGLGGLLMLLRSLPMKREVEFTHCSLQPLSGGILKSGEVKRYRAKYAFTLWAELEKSIALGDSEVIQAQSRVKKYSNWLYTPPGLLQVTSERLFVLTHHTFAPDQILEIPLTAVRRIESDGQGWITVEYDAAGEAESVRLMPWSRVMGSTAALLSLSDKLAATPKLLVEDPDHLLSLLRQAVKNLTRESQ